MIYLLFLAAAMIELLGITISVIGVGQLVGMNLIIILMAISFDIGKIATVSSLQRNWKTLNWVMRIYGGMAIAVTMCITSFGAASYLTSAMQSGIVSVESLNNQIDAMKTEKTRLELRKIQIDTQIANIPPDASTKFRNSVIGTFQAEQDRVTTRLTELETKIPELEMQKITTGGKASGLVSLSKSLNIETNQLIKFIVFLIIFVFDPFAIYLIMSGNHMLLNKNKITDAPVDNREEIPEPAPSNPASPINEPPKKQAAFDNEELIASEHDAPLTIPAVPSILETVEDRASLFENDLNVPSQVVSTYRAKPMVPLHKGVDL